MVHRESTKPGEIPICKFLRTVLVLPLPYGRPHLFVCRAALRHPGR